MWSRRALRGAEGRQIVERARSHDDPLAYIRRTLYSRVVAVNRRSPRSGRRRQGRGEPWHCQPRPRSYGSYSEAKAGRVRKAAQQLQYRPNAVARAL